MNFAQRLILFSVFCVGSAFAQTEVNSTGATEITNPTEEASPAAPDGRSEEAQAPAETTPPAGEAPVVVEPSAPSQPVLKTAANKEFNKALNFHQVDHGVTLPPVEIEYDLTQQDGKSLRLGNVLLSEKNFFFALSPLGKAHSQVNQVLSSSESKRMMLLISWPEKLLNFGTIEMISTRGNVLWSHEFSEQDQSEWARKVEDWRRALIARGNSTDSVGRSGLFATKMGIEVDGANIPVFNQRDSFRFCITQTIERNSTKICSQRYGTRTTGKNVVMGKVRQDVITPRVLIQNEQGALKNSVPVPADAPASFYADLASGESYEFVVVPPKLDLMDIVQTNKSNVLKIVGYDLRPIGKSIILNPDQYSSLVKSIGFEATIGDPRKFWATLINTQDPKIYLPGKGGGVFKQRLELSIIPRQEARVYLHRRTPVGTYIDGFKLEGRKQPGAELATEQKSVEVDEKDPTRFVWTFKAEERGKINRSYLDVNFQGKSYRSYYEMYKGYPRELSGRFTGVTAADTFIFLGEVAYNQWFEDIFGWTNYWIARQRWGISGKYFQSFNQLKVNAAGDTAPLSVLTVDLKYRLTPGLWGRDETVGALVSYQAVTFDVLKAPMLGVGAFWARSMPKVFDDIFNIVPLMRYPKWVDMEFIYYPSSLDSKIVLNAPMSLNFHGKVLWSDWLFGEAGFGMKRYSYTDKELNRKAELNTFYGTVGLGINF